MATMRAVQISRPEGPLEVVERPVPQPEADQILIRIEACGICHGDILAVAGHGPHMAYPRIPGHEAVGVVEETGAAVTRWRAGDRVGIRWFYDPKTFRINGVSVDGGYAEYVLALEDAVVPLPKGPRAADLAPLMCAGVTTFSALKHSPARPGEVVAIVGVGGLGHLAVQYARAFGYFTVALSRGPEKCRLAAELGAHRAIDTAQEDAVEGLAALGGAKVILVTAPHAGLASRLVDGLGRDGQMIIVAGMSEPLAIVPGKLLAGHKSIRGWTPGPIAEVVETIRFSEQAGIHAMTEVYPLEQAPEAFERMLAAKAQFRCVLEMPRKE